MLSHISANESKHMNEIDRYDCMSVFLFKKRSIQSSFSTRNSDTFKQLCATEEIDRKKIHKKKTAANNIE